MSKQQRVLYNKQEDSIRICVWYYASTESIYTYWYYIKGEKVYKRAKERNPNLVEESTRRNKKRIEKNINNKRFPVTCIVCGKVHYVGKRSSQLKTKYCKSCGLTGKNIEYKGMHFMSEEECGVYKYLNTKYNIILCQVRIP